ncbi:DegT/DnrJ/EryC1/StrS family aminotransferase [Phormidium pseudopriestleyi FRX01]|uniref:DegT/DnrJ/EryC1/StrS family aminotransferase n=1 Tax=Phormidium pseudopriestleyi FRX01 TaxID=1759528 RepID=A0ABS3FT34_9CYAN|nr:DegT/DnrJ/EryC1/StrS family aminotransferase [Phormidium pseudopriestleyi]MBO0350283.1 DegT/DnrJ/EryC1/StrS family aminotransferase [Phormidium pseudopriestleyi FRX01]
MWSRKRFDIDYIDLIYGLGAALTVGNSQRQGLQNELEDWWISDSTGEAIACLSVRSGWDLLLQALQLPPGSEVAMSALTIPDMVTIVRHHGLVPVPIDLDPMTMAPDPASLDRAIGPQTRVIIIAHLFGGRVNLEPILAARDRVGAILVEDCAQAFTPGFRGHPDADVSCFSFGNIKFATALGGALLRVRDPQLGDCLRQIQSTYPVQDSGHYTRRLLKYLGLKTLSSRPGFTALIWGCRRLGIDYDRLLNQSVKGFPKDELIPRLRHQPWETLLALLRRRLQGYTEERLAAQTHRGQRLIQLLQDYCPQILVPGVATLPHVHWVVPILAQDPEMAIATLANAGFDSTQGNSMTVVNPPETHLEWEPRNAREIFKHLLYLPCYPAMDDTTLVSMAQALRPIFSPSVSEFLRMGSP